MDIEYIQQAIDFAKAKNPIWPFSSVIVDENGKIVCKATDCAHISPIFHAETLAIHVLISEKKNNFGKLTLYSTAEPDAMSQSAIHWANIAHDLSIHKIVYGSSLNTIQNIWPFGIRIPAKEVIDRSNSKIELVGAVHEQECDHLFKNAKFEQGKYNNQHPARDMLSDDIKDFYELMY